MADEEKEKAEKLAAAKKRFEQLKKEQAKKGKKAATKKKKDESASTAAEDKTEDTAPADEILDRASPADGDGTYDAAEQQDGVDAKDLEAEKPAPPQRTPSLSLQSKRRSESFRAGSGPLSPGNEVTDLYRKQSLRIEELEAENKTLKQHQDESANRLAKTEEDLESLREGSRDVVEHKSTARDVDSLKADVESLKRQLAQALKEGAGKRRASGHSPDIAKELESKTGTIETLEMEISGLRNHVNVLQTKVEERESSVRDAQEQVAAAETAAENSRKELEQLKVSMTFPSDETNAASEDPEALQKRISVLESDLRTANTSLDAAGQRARSLEQKLETLTKMHKDASIASQAKDRELGQLRSEMRMREKPSHVRDVSDFDLQDEETEAGSLHARIRELEAENFELKRGIWREHRASLQPSMDDASPYEDIDLNGPYTPGSRSRSSGPRQSSTFQDILNSGISAFTGRPRDPRGSQSIQGQKPLPERKQSLGLLSEDGEIDADAWAQAQEEEAKRRVERVKEVKKGLDKWRGWRIDLVELRRSSGVFGAGPVFEV